MVIQAINLMTGSQVCQACGCLVMVCLGVPFLSLSVDFSVSIARFVFFEMWEDHHQDMGVSKNRGTPKWMVKIMENPGWFGGTIILGNTHIVIHSVFPHFIITCWLQVQMLFFTIAWWPCVIGLVSGNWLHLWQCLAAKQRPLSENRRIPSQRIESPEVDWEPSFW